MIARYLLAAASICLLASCSSGSKKSANESENKTASVAAAPLTSEAVLTKYSLQELNSAATALRVVSDSGKGKEILGCDITDQKALSMMMPIKALIDQQSRAEVESYETDPKGYANTEGFESCAKNCSCGVYSDVVSAASERKMPAGSGVAHKRNVAKLRAKAERQGEDQSLTCARKQTWFCSSDLHKFLDKGAAEMP